MGPSLYQKFCSNSIIHKVNHIRSFLASKAIADAVAVDAVRPGDGDGTVTVAVAAAAVNCDGCEVNSCSFSCSLKFFGFGGDRLGERRRSRLLCLLWRRECRSRLWRRRWSRWCRQLRLAECDRLRSSREWRWRRPLRLRLRDRRVAGWLCCEERRLWLCMQQCNVWFNDFRLNAINNALCKYEVG